MKEKLLLKLSHAHSRMCSLWQVCALMAESSSSHRDCTARKGWNIYYPVLYRQSKGLGSPGDRDFCRNFSGLECSQKALEELWPRLVSSRHLICTWIADSCPTLGARRAHKHRPSAGLFGQQRIVECGWQRMLGLIATAVGPRALLKPSKQVSDWKNESGIW